MRRGSAFKWVVLFVLVFGSAAANFSNAIFASRPVDVMAQFGMAQAQLTAVSAIGILPGALFSVAMGNFFDRKGAKAIRYVAAALLFMGAAFQAWRVFATTYTELLIITFAAGALFTPVQVLPAKLIEAWFDREQIGLASGIWGAAACTGATLAFVIGGALPSSRAAFAAVAIAFGLVAICWLLFARMPYVSADEYKDLATARLAQQADATHVSLKAVVKSRNMWLIMFCSGVTGSVPLLINTYMVTAFLDKGLDPVAASMLGVVFNVVSIVGAAASGAIISRVGRFNVPFLVICIGGGVLFLITYLVPTGPATFVFLIAAGLVSAGGLAACIGRVGLLHLTGDFHPANTGIAGGMNNTAMGLFGFFLPTLTSAALGDNYLAVFIAILVYFVLAGIIGGAIIPELGEKGTLASNRRERQS